MTIAETQRLGLEVLDGIEWLAVEFPEWPFTVLVDRDHDDPLPCTIELTGSGPGYVWAQVWDGQALMEIHPVRIALVSHLL